MSPVLRETAERLDAYRARCAGRRGLGPAPKTYHYRLWDDKERPIRLDRIDASFRAHIAASVPDLTITRHGAPYLERWYVERSPERCIYLHRFAGDDPDVGPHDHPWDSASLLVAGVQFETWLPDGSDRNPPRHRHLIPGSVSYRGARFAHQLRVRPRSEPPLTIFVTGPMSRSWGFWVERDGVRRLERHPVELREEREAEPVEY